MAGRRFFRVPAAVMALGVAGWCLLGVGAAHAALPSTIVVEQATAASAQSELASKLDRIFDAAEFENAFWGVRIERANGSVIYERNAQKRLMPASNMKLVTTGAALELLGPDYKYETKLEARGKISAEGKLDGDLVIVGSGDPSLGTWRIDGRPDGDALLKGWAEKVKAAGIKEVSGAVVSDGRVWNDDYINGDWPYSELPFWYAAGTCGVNFSENVFRFTTAPGANVGDKATLSFKPVTKYFTVENDVVTTATKGVKDADITRRYPGSNEVIFGGTIPVDEKPFEQRGSVADGELYAATLFTEALEREGVKVDQPPASARKLTKPVRIDSVSAADRKELDRVSSPPMSELVRMVNKPSHNFYADCLFRTMGAVKGKNSGWDGGRKVVQDWVKGFEPVDGKELQIVDGSGLARRDYVTAKMMCALLQHMRKNEKVFEIYKTSLPTPGQESKDRKGWKAPELIGNMYAKTGFIGHVRALSGYVKSKDGEQLVFSMIANNFSVPISRADEVADAAALLLAKSEVKNP